MRKKICIFIAVLLLLAYIAHTSADQTSVAYCVLSPQANATISEQSADEPTGVAGLAKLPAVLTLCYAVDRGLLAPDTIVSVGMRAAQIGGQTIFLKNGEQVKAEELLRAAVMISAGDAIWALMESAFGSEDVFLQNISLTLKEFGIDHPMQNALGANERFTCREIACMGCAALNSATFMKYCSCKYAVLEHPDGRKTEIANANKLLTTLPGCVGLLTGSSKTDGYCGVFACKRGNTTFVCAMSGAQNSKSRFELVTQLLEEAFAGYAINEIASANEPILEAYPVDGGDSETVNLFTKESVSVLLKKSDGSPQQQFHLPEVLQAPLDPEFSVGSVTFAAPDGTILYELALYPEKSISATGFREILKRILISYRNS